MSSHGDTGKANSVTHAPCIPKRRRRIELPLLDPFASVPVDHQLSCTALWNACTETRKRLSLAYTTKSIFYAQTCIWADTLPKMWTDSGRKCLTIRKPRVR